MYATVMQGRGGGGQRCGCATAAENEGRGGADGIARQDTETGYTTGGLSQDRLPRQVLRQVLR